MKWLIAMALLLILAACQTAPAPADRATNTSPDSPPARGRAQMWMQNCIRCHNARSPGYYSDREWQIAMHHMRLRCSISKEEYDAILSFLQSAN